MDNTNNLSTAEEFYTSIIKNSFDAILVIDTQGIINFASPAALQITGYSAEELLSKSSLDLVHPEDKMITSANLHALVQDATKVIRFELRYIHKSNKIKWIEVIGTNLLGDSAVNGIVVNFHDVTLAKETELELQKYYLAVEDAMEHIIITDAEGFILYANKAAEHMTGYTLEEMKGKTPALWGKQMPKEFYQDLWTVIGTNKDKFTGRVTNRRKNGELYEAEVRISPIIDKNVVKYYVGIEQDITRKP